MPSPAKQLKRAGQLDALAAVLPMAAADRYVEVLTDADVATLRHPQISAANLIKLRPAHPTSPPEPCVRIDLSRRKTTTAGQGAFVFAAGRAAVDLHEWIQADNMTSGPIFREVRKDGSIGTDPLTVQSVNLILEKALPDGGAGFGRVQRPCIADEFYDPS